MNQKTKIAMDPIKKTKKKSRINWDLIPIKLHYALFWGGAAPAVLFMPLLAQKIGLDESAIGLIYTAGSLLTLVFQPFCGAISDYIKNTKAVLMVIEVIVAIMFFSLLYITPIKQIELPHYITLICQDQGFKVEPGQNYDSVCLSRVLTKKFLCESSRHDIFPTQFCNKILPQPPLNFSESSVLYGFSNDVNCSAFQLKQCGDQDIYWTSCNPLLSVCHANNTTINKMVYGTYQFWVFAILSALGLALVSTCYSLSDATCYAMLGENKRLFGYQRLFSTCSYGIGTFLAGYLNDLFADDPNSDYYDMGYYVMLVMFFMDFVVLLRMKSVNVSIEKFSFKDVKQVLISSKVIVFVVGVFFVGILTSILYNYQFLFLKSIGAPQTLLGITMLIQNDVANLLFFLIAGKVVESLGHVYCLILTFAAFAIRFFLYFILSNPWYMLPVEMLDGITFSIFYVAMTDFAKTNAQPGTEATMMGTFTGTYAGLGFTLGSFLGGIGFEKLSGASTYLLTAVGSSIMTLGFLVIKLMRHKSTYTIKPI